MKSANLRRALAVICTTIIPTAFAVPAWDKASLEAAESFLHVNPAGADADIHKADRFPDNARGFYVEALPPLRTYTPEVGKSARDQMLAQSFCGADLIALAKAGDSFSTLTSGNASILTRTEFEVVDVVKSRSGRRAGQRVSVVQIGGEVIDQGVRLRVVDERGDPLIEGQTYLLTLVRPTDSSSQDFFARGVPVPVRAGRIDHGSGRWEPFVGGGTYKAVKQEMLRMKC